MKLISTVIPLVALFSVTSATITNINVRHDSGYDVNTSTPRMVDCLSDRNGPLAGVKNFGEVKTFPYIGAADVVKSDHSGCGSCWEMSYEGNVVVITVVDSAPDGFNLTRKAMDDLTANSGQVIIANATQLPGSDCGL